MPGSSNSQSRGYLARMLSVNSNGAVLNGNAGSRSNLKRMNEELRSHILKLKTDLDSEKAKSKQTHREKVAEIKRVKDEYERENHKNLDIATFKMNTIKENEIKRLRESLTRDKDSEIKQIIKYKDEEIKTLQKTMLEEKEQALRKAEEKFFYEQSSRNKSFSDEQERKLKKEIAELKKIKNEADENLREQILIVAEKNELIKKLKSGHDRELQRVLREARRENSRSISELQTLKRSLSERTSEISKLEVYASKVAEEKEELLSEKIRLDRLSISRERNSMTSSQDGAMPLSPRMEKEMDLHAKNVELQRQLNSATRLIKRMDKENNSQTLSATAHSSELSSSSASDKRVRELKRRNAELVAIAKKLEDKSKQIQKELHEIKSQKVSRSKATESVSSLKKSFAIQRAKDLADHARTVLLKDKELEELRQRKENHEEQIMFKEIEKALQLAAKERLRLEHQLSTSTPVSTEEATQLKSELDVTNEMLKEMSEKYSDLQQTHSACAEQQEYIDEKLEEVDMLTNQLKVKEEECVALSKNLMNKDKEMLHLRKEMKEKELTCCELIKGSDVLKSNVKTLEENISELKKQLRTIEQLRREYKKLEMDLDNANNNCERMLEKIRELEYEIKHLKEQVDSQLQEIDSLETSKANLNRTLKAKSKQVEELTKLEEELKLSHNMQINSMESKLQSYEEEIRNLKNSEVKILKDRKEKIIEMVQSGSTKQQNVRSIAVQTDEKSGDSIVEKNVRILSSMDNERASLDNVFVEETKSPALKRTSTSSYGSELDPAEYSIKSEDIGARIEQLAVSISEAESLLEMKESPENLEPNSIAFETDIEDDDDDVEVVEDHDDDDDKEEDHDADNVDDVVVVNADIDNVHLDNGSKDNGNQTFVEVNDEKEPPKQGTIDEINRMVENLKESGTNPVKLFVSRYTYDPALYSPNEDHEVELPLELGMYLYVYGDMDEDGFYLAELQSGRRGLVPSNLIERVNDNNITNSADHSNESDTDLSEAEYLLSTNALKTKYPTTEQNNHVTQEGTFLLESEEEDEDSDDIDEVCVSSPRNLSIERQLNSSIVITWKEPLDLYHVKGYAIYVNDQLKQTVLGSARRKALVSDLQSDEIYHISVRTVRIDGTESNGNLAVLTVGKGSTHAPYDLSVTNLTTVSANLTWKPSNSSYHHVIFINDTEVTSTGPGFYKFVLRELQPATNYSVTVEARTFLHKKSPLEWTATQQFTTLDGIRPEAPLDVRGELENGLLNITWIPVTINKHGTSNGSVVTGYKVYIENLDLIFVDIATVDSAQISFDKLEKLFAVHKDEYTIFVRTQSTSGESENSNLFVLNVGEDVMHSNKTFTAQFIEIDDARLSLVDNDVTEDVITAESQSDVFESADGDEWFEKNDKSFHEDDTEEIEKPTAVEEMEKPSHYNPENTTHFAPSRTTDGIVVNADEERIIVSDDDLSVIDEECEIELVSDGKLDDEEHSYAYGFKKDDLVDGSNMVFDFKQDSFADGKIVIESLPVETKKVSTMERIFTHDTEKPELANTSGIQTDSADTVAERTDTLGTGGDTLLDVSSENKFLLTEESDKITKYNEISPNVTKNTFHKKSTGELDTSLNSATNDVTSSSISREYVSEYVKDVIKSSYDLLNESYTNDQSAEILNTGDGAVHGQSGSRSPLYPDNRVSFNKNKMSFHDNEMLFNDSGVSFHDNKTSLNDNDALFHDNEALLHDNEVLFPDNEVSFPDNKVSFPDNDASFSISSEGVANYDLSMKNRNDWLGKNTEDGSNLPIPTLKKIQLKNNSFGKEEEYTDYRDLDDIQNIDTNLHSDDFGSNANLVSTSPDEPSETDDLTPTNDSLSQFTDSINDLIELEQSRNNMKTQPSKETDTESTFNKINLVSSIKDSSSEVNDKLASVPQTYSINSSDVIISTPKTYSVNDKLGEAVDENHNKTFSLNSYVVLPSSVNINSAELIGMLEKDAHRDILDEYPELPLDTFPPDNQEEKLIQPIEERLAYNKAIENELVTEKQTLRLDEKSEKQMFDEPLNFNDKKLSLGFQNDDVDRDDGSVNPIIPDNLLLTNQTKQDYSEEPPKLDNVSTADSLSALVSSSTDVDADSIEGSVPLSNFQLSSVKSSRDTEPTNDPSSIVFSESDGEVNALLNMDMPEIKKIEPEYTENMPVGYSSKVTDVSPETGNVAKQIVTKVEVQAEVTNADLAQDNDIKPSEDGQFFTPEEASLPISSSAKRSLKFEDIDITKTAKEPADASETQNSESLKITKPLNNIYSFGDIEFTESEKSDTEIDVSRIEPDHTDDDDEFDVTPIHGLDDTTESNVVIDEMGSVQKFSTEVQNEHDFSELAGNALMPQSSVAEIGLKDTSITDDDDKDVPDVLSQPDQKDRIRIFVALYPYNPLTMSPNVEYAEEELAFEEGALIKVYGEVDEDGFFFGELDGVTGMVPSNMVAEVALEDVDRALDKKKEESETSSDVNNKTDSFDVSFMVEKKQRNPAAAHLTNSEPSLHTDNDNVSLQGSSENGKDSSRKASWKTSSTQQLAAPKYDPFMAKSHSMSDVRDARKNERIDPYKLQPLRMIALFDYDPTISSPNVDAEIELAFQAKEIIHVYGDIDEDGFYMGKINGRKGLVPSNFIRLATEQDEQQMVASGGSSPSAQKKPKKRNSLFRKSKKILSKLTRK
ncbi:uncharacterized protein LOC130624310 isoform X2 [Hydractinia symbiolongicarpus]|uniref:uncharacterized protein LOC130624310 isoform X2 n=1 Tax=Hydractinia symbiolongicarpus TaxID=13093 RepID=UPI00254B6F60|nr:uncharacterized protein LOC130624310 isoform X2 [Hydractinia symbiolongicarpus]